MILRIHPWRERGIISATHWNPNVYGRRCLIHTPSERSLPMMLSVIMPVYNEIDTIREITRRMLAEDRKQIHPIG